MGFNENTARLARLCWASPVSSRDPPVCPIDSAYGWAVISAAAEPLRNCCRGRLMRQGKLIMVPFGMETCTVRGAVVAALAGGRYIAGGTTLIDLMREEVEQNLV